MPADPLRPAPLWPEQPTWAKPQYSPPWPPAAPGMQRSGWWAMALLHLVALWALHLAMRPDTRARPAPPPAPMAWLTLRLLAPPMARPPVPDAKASPQDTAPQAPRTALLPPRRDRPGPPPPLAAMPNTPTARPITLPAVAHAASTPAAPVPDASMPPTAQPAGAAASAARLNLHWTSRTPSGAPASAPPSAWAQQDERVRPTRSASERFAQTLGTDLSLQVQDMANGGKRWRRGSQCVDTKPARETQLNPMDDAAKRLPHLAKEC